MGVAYKLIALAVAGAIGTLARYALAGLVSRHVDVSFPWGTMAVNVAGCLLAGMFWALAEQRVSISGDLRAVVMIGFMGGFTTFSAYMLETANLLRGGQWAFAAGNIMLQNVLGLAALLGGLVIGSRL